MQSVLDRLGGFSQQSSVYNVLGRAFSLPFCGGPLTLFTSFFTGWSGYFRRFHCWQWNYPPLRALSELKPKFNVLI